MLSNPKHQLLSVELNCREFTPFVLPEIGDEERARSNKLRAANLPMTEETICAFKNPQLPKTENTQGKF